IWMVFLVVSQTTKQLGHSLRWLSSSFRSAASTLPSRYSLSSLRKSLHVTKEIVPFPLEIAGQFLSQPQTRPKQPALDRGNRKIQRQRGLFGRKLLNVPQREHRPKRGRQALHSSLQDGPD